MSPLRLGRWLLPGVCGVLALAGCSSGSSAGGAPAPTSTASQGIDRASVDAALDQVLAGLQAATAISASGGLGAAATGLLHAASDLDAAAKALNPSPAGVPDATALPVSTGLFRVADLLTKSGTCLTAQAALPTPNPKVCLPPLRKAEARDAALSHGLISLSVYGSKSPKVFESELVAALGGR